MENSNDGSKKNQENYEGNTLTINTKQIDLVAVFLGYTAVCGDIQKVALLFDLDPKLVEQLAEENLWVDKLKRLSLVSKDGNNSSEWAKCQSRALSYVQGHMLRSILQRVIENVGAMSREDLVGTVTAVKAGSVTFTAKFYHEISGAMESAHRMCSNALQDSPADRGLKEKSADEETMSIEKLHSAVLMALSGASGAGVERKLLDETSVGEIPKKT